jgi:hypothetical protein
VTSTCVLDCVRQCKETALASVEWYRTVAVTVRTVVWDGYTMGKGTGTPTNRVISPKPKVRQVTAREVAASGGLFTLEDLKVGPITPDYVCGNDSGGYSPAQLDPEGGPKTEILYILTGDVDGTYRLIRSEFTKPTGYFLYLRLSARTPRRTP